ncbi:CHASE2 domain-containing protein [Thermodesulfobacteriota bacterium]
MKLLKEISIPRFVPIYIGGLLLILFAEFMGFFNGIDNYFYDFYFRLRGTQQYSKRIVIVAIDEESLLRLGRWPISRAYYAQLLNRLGQAKAVALDILLSEPSEEDPALGEAIKQHGRVILPIYIDDQLNLSSPVRAFSSAKTGHIHLEQGIDGVVRNIFHTISLRGTSRNSFASTIFDLISPKPSKEMPPPGSPAQKGPDLNTIIQTNPMYINYYGARGTYLYLSLSDVIDGQWPPSFFKDKIILVGVTCPGFEDSILTPFSQERNRMPGVEVHAHILNNLLDQKFIRHAGRWFMWPAAAILSILGFFLFTQFSGIRSAGIWLVGLLAVSVLTFSLFAVTELWIAPAVFYFSMTFAFLMAYIFQLQKMGSLLLQAKEDWEESFNRINDAIVIHDEGCRIVRANSAAMNNLGDPLLELLCNRCFQLQKGKSGIHSDNLEAENSAGISQIVDEIHDPETDRHLEIKSLTRFDDKQQFTGAVQIVRDITERVKTEEERHRLQSQLAQAQKLEAIGTLTGGIAHDFNNILTAILGYTELASRATIGSNTKRQLREVLKGGQRAKELIDQILTVSRPTEQEKKRLQIGPVIEEVLNLLKSIMPSTIEVRAEIESKGIVLGNPAQIHQILMNLCTNAYHAMLEKGGILNVYVHDAQLEPDSGQSDLPSGPSVKITVSDTGHGMTREVVERIFNPYFTTKKKGEGTGLGLAVVHGIVKNHGGGIKVQSESGKGTTFEIFLPSIDQEQADDERDSISLPTGNERILLIDDEETLVEMEKEMLEQLGYDIVAKADSVEALDLFRAQPEMFDLVITDQTMPHLTGTELARKLLLISPDTPIILCTGFSEVINEEKAKSIGISEYVMKPLVMGDLARTVRKALDKRSSES